MNEKFFDIAVIGGGASGLAAAISALRFNGKKKLAIFEKNPRIGKKILVTGNGRCNISNNLIDESFYCASSSFAIDVIKNAGENAVIEFFKSLGLAFRRDYAGRLYPASNQAAAVLDVLRFEIERLGVNVITENSIYEIEKINGGFILNGEYRTKKLIIATGGCAAPKTGSDGSGYELLKSLKIKINPHFPALTSLFLENYPPSLKGLRVQCSVNAFIDNKNIASDTGEVQFNENGISGIPIMQISRAFSKALLVEKKQTLKLILDVLPEMSKDDIAKYIYERININPNLLSENLFTGLMAKKLASHFLKELNIPLNIPINNIGKDKITLLSKLLKAKSYGVKAVQGFDGAQVTAGGADTSQFSSITLESFNVKGLYCCGEILDVDALCGGYNLHWAWCSGIVSGRAAAFDKKQ